MPTYSHLALKTAPLSLEDKKLRLTAEEGRRSLPGSVRRMWANKEFVLTIGLIRLLLLCVELFQYQGIAVCVQE